MPLLFLVKKNLCSINNCVTVHIVLTDGKKSSPLGRQSKKILSSTLIRNAIAYYSAGVVVVNSFLLLLLPPSLLQGHH
jgi:hypothetical protein